MEAENDEATKLGHGNSFSLLNTIAFTLPVSAVVAVAGYLGYPLIINLLEGVCLWFEWFHSVLKNIFIIFIILNALIGSIYFIFLKTTDKKKPDRDLCDEYIAAASSVVRPSLERSFPPMEVEDFGGGYNDNSSYQESVPPVQAVINTVEEYNCYERVVTETNSKSYRRTTRSEKKMRSTEEYQRTGSERVMKTASWRSQAIDELSSEEFRMTVETFIMKNKCYWQNGVADHWQNGVPRLQNSVVDQWQNGVPRLQNSVVDKWQNGVPQLQNGGADQWQNGVPQLQNGGADQWQNYVPQWQGQPEYDGTDLHRRLVGGSGSTGTDGSYLAISN